MSQFNNTQSISAFANGKGIAEMRTIENPKTGKVFGVAKISDGSELTLALSEKLNGVITMDCNVSWFTPEDGSESFWMIHPRGEGGKVISTLSFAPVKVNAEDAI